MTTTFERLATVLSWDDAAGTGRIVQDLFDQKQSAIDRSLLVGTDSLAVGQRVAFIDALGTAAAGESPWRIQSVRPIADDATYWAGVVEGLCRAVDDAESDLRVATEAADDDTVTRAQSALAAAREVRDSKVPEIAHEITARCVDTTMVKLPGFADTIYGRREDLALQAVLEQVDERYRGVVLKRWKPLLDTLAEIRENDYLPAE